MSIERAAILSTGDELTTGRTVDTNANFLADRLTAAGIEVATIIAVGDEPDRIAWAWGEGMRLADLVISTGGLGPTADDRTTEAVARLANRRLVWNEEVATRIRQIFAAMNRPMPENNLKQAWFPEGAEVLPNPLGTAPGFRLSIETGSGWRHLIALPGVPREMTRMVEDSVLPWLAQARGKTEVYASRVFQTFGASESALDELVAGALPETEGRVAFRAAFPQISVRVTVAAPPGEVEQRLARAAERLRQRIAPYVYAEGETTMEEVVGQLLRERHKTLAIAESCTGGLIGHRITNVPGSSAYLLGVVVAYANAVKQTALGVSAATLARFGAVSEEVAREMAAGVRRLTGADAGLATTGIAGPEGGTPDKPVGTLCLALDTAEGCFSRRYQLWGNREWIKLLASQLALDWVRRWALGHDPTASGWQARGQPRAS